MIGEIPLKMWTESSKSMIASVTTAGQSSWMQLEALLYVDELFSADEDLISHFGCIFVYNDLSAMT